MRIDYLSSDILLFRGDSPPSLATAFIDGARVLLVDTLGNAADAAEMRAYLEDTRGMRVEAVVLAHADGEHMAGLGLFPGVPIIAQRRFSEAAAVATGCAVTPATLVDQHLELTWGRHRLALFHTPGQSACALGIDVADADLLFVADHLVGNVARIGSATPEQADAALAQLQARGRGRIVPGYLGVQHGDALGNARHYLAQLGERVVHLRGACPENAVERTVAAIALEDCLAPGLFATPPEREWHRQNLRRVAEGALFPAAARVPAPQAQGKCLTRCRETIMSVLTAMLGRLAERGV